MENTISKKELIDMMTQLAILTEKDPSRELGLYHLILTYNLFVIDEVDLAEQCFARIEPIFFTERVRTILEQSLDEYQEVVRLNNCMEATVDPRQKAYEAVRLQEASRNAEIYEVLTGFFQQASKSENIMNSPQYAEMCIALDGFSKEIDLTAGLPVVQ